MIFSYLLMLASLLTLMLLQMYSQGMSHFMVADVKALSTAEYPAVKDSEPCSCPALSKIAYMSKTFAASKTFAGAQQARRPVQRSKTCAGAQQARRPVPPSKRLRRSGSARRRRGGSQDEGLCGKEWGFLMRKAKPLPCLVTNESS